MGLNTICTYLSTLQEEVEGRSWPEKMPHFSAPTPYGVDTPPAT